MSRLKYGIDLGTTNSAIAVIDKGESIIIKSEIQKDNLLGKYLGIKTKMHI